MKLVHKTGGTDLTENYQDTNQPNSDTNNIVPNSANDTKLALSGTRVALSGTEEWYTIVNQLVGELTATDAPDQIIEATELLLVGLPIYKVARKIGTTSATVRRWLSMYPTMAAVVASGRKLLSQWRMSKLEQQFLSAVERSQEVLDLELNGTTRDGVEVDPKVLTVVAAQARYIIGLFAGQKIDVEVRHELGETVFKAKQEALDYLVQKLSEQRDGAEVEPIEATYRIVDAKMDTGGPVLDEDGNPPFGKLGELDRNEKGTLCHICGGRYKDQAKHLLTTHSATVEEYEQTYMLAEGAVRAAQKEDGRSLWA